MFSKFRNDYQEVLAEMQEPKAETPPEEPAPKPKGDVIRPTHYYPNGFPSSQLRKEGQP